MSDSPETVMKRELDRLTSLFAERIKEAQARVRSAEESCHALSLDSAAKIQRIVELTAEVARLRDLLDRDRTGLAAGLNQVRQAAKGYAWIGAGEWGSYDYTEQTEATLRREVQYMLDGIESLAVTALRQSGERANEAFNPKKPVTT